MAPADRRKSDRSDTKKPTGDYCVCHVGLSNRREDLDSRCSGFLTPSL